MKVVIQKYVNQLLSLAVGNPSAISMLVLKLSKKLDIKKLKFDFRKIFVSFLSLTLSQRTMIARKLDLLKPVDKSITDFERFRVVLVDACTQDKLSDLEKEIAKLD